MDSRSFVLASFGFAAVLASGARAQCVADWVGGSVPGVLGSVHSATSWDQDGAGPLPPVIVMGGDFTLAGPIAANRIVAFDPVAGTWSAFGSGFDDGFVSALAVMPNGDLVAAGWFPAAGGVPMNNIARWNGTTWAPLGQGVDNTVRALAVLPNGTLIAGGYFAHAGGASAAAIASWDGAAWSALAGGLAGQFASTNPAVNALAVRANGVLVVGGWFWYAGGQLSKGLAEWNAGAWTPFGNVSDGGISALHIAANGDVLAGCWNLTIGGVPTDVKGIARWDGSTWFPLGAGPLLSVWGIHELPNGDVIVGGGLGVGSGPANAVRRWDGVSWYDVWGAPAYGQQVWCVAPAPNGDVFVGGDVQFPGALRGFGLLQPNLVWRSLPLAFNGIVFALHRLPNGDLLAGGTFDQAPGAVVYRVARFDGTSWHSMGGFSETVMAFAHLANGDPVLGGTLGIVQRWNGTMWTPLGNGFNGQITSLALAPNGDLIAAGGFPDRVARWDGTSWSTLPGLSNIVWALAVLGDGTIVAAGYFPGSVAAWNGTAWNVLGNGSPGATKLAMTTNGDLIAAGSTIQRWDGSAWHGLGAITNGFVAALSPTPDGGVAAGGTFTMIGGVPANKIARWDGAAWHALGSGITDSASGAPSPYAIDVGPDGEITVGGQFTSAGGLGSMNLARWTTSCPASWFAYGAGCTGSGGLAVLTPRTSPWVGGTYRTRATGMPALGVAVSVTGLAQISVPLVQLLPEALPGCDLLATPELLLLHLPQAGVADVALVFPNDPTFAGLVFTQQVVAIEMGATGNFVAITSTGALQATMGGY